MSAALAALAMIATLVSHTALAASQNLTVQVLSSSTATTSPPIIPSGGGGGGGSIVRSDTGITVSGRAYPLSRVYVLRDGTRVVDTIAGPDGRFSATVLRISTGTHTISVYAEDAAGRSSVAFSFPLSVTAGATTAVSGIFVSPTIDTDKSAVRRGDPVTVFGRTAPDANVSVEFNSQTRIFESVSSDENGVYLYQLDSSRLELGDHTVQARAATSSELSTQSGAVAFLVGNANVFKSGDTDCGRMGDIDCDGRISLKDYSIVAYWYGRNEAPPARVDLNHDGRVTLADLSILAYYWTG